MTIAPVQTRSDVVRRVRKEAGTIRALGVRRLALFGSFVRDEAGATSDVDFLVQFEKGEKTFDRFIELASLLQDRMGRKIELVTTEALSPYIGPEILSEAVDVPLAS